MRRPRPFASGEPIDAELGNCSCSAACDSVTLALGVDEDNYQAKGGPVLRSKPRSKGLARVL